MRRGGWTNTLRGINAFGRGSHHKKVGLKPGGFNGVFLSLLEVFFVSVTTRTPDICQLHPNERGPLGVMNGVDHPSLGWSPSPVIGRDPPPLLFFFAGSPMASIQAHKKRAHKIFLAHSLPK